MTKIIKWHQHIPRNCHWKWWAAYLSLTVCCHEPLHYWYQDFWLLLSICGTVCPSISPQHTLQQATEYVFRPTSRTSSAQLYSACVVTLNHLLITWYITYLTNTPQVCHTTCTRYSTSSSKFYNKSHYNRRTSKVLTIIMPMTGRKKPQHNKEQLNTLYILMQYWKKNY